MRLLLALTRVLPPAKRRSAPAPASCACAASATNPTPSLTQPPPYPLPPQGCGGQDRGCGVKRRPARQPSPSGLGGAAERLSPSPAQPPLPRPTHPTPPPFSVQLPTALSVHAPTLNLSAVSQQQVAAAAAAAPAEAPRQAQPLRLPIVPPARCPPGPHMNTPFSDAPRPARCPSAALCRVPPLAPLAGRGRRSCCACCAAPAAATETHPPNVQFLNAGRGPGSPAAAARDGAGTASPLPLPFVARRLPPRAPVLLSRPPNQKCSCGPGRLARAAPRSVLHFVPSRATCYACSPLCSPSLLPLCIAAADFMDTELLSWHNASCCLSM